MPNKAKFNKIGGFSVRCDNTLNGSLCLYPYNYTFEIDGVIFELKLNSIYAINVEELAHKYSPFIIGYDKIVLDTSKKMFKVFLKKDDQETDFMVLYNKETPTYEKTKYQVNSTASNSIGKNTFPFIANGYNQNENKTEKKSNEVNGIIEYKNSNIKLHSDKILIKLNYVNNTFEIKYLDMDTEYNLNEIARNILNFLANLEEFYKRCIELEIAKII
jgi:hypothetical protein